MSYYPILIDLKGKKTVVVGGGIVAQRKIEALLEGGADVHVISRELTPELQKYLEDKKIKLLGREFSGDYLQEALIVIAATDEPELNHRISELAKEKGILINAVDQPSDCDFIVPSVIRRGDLVIAVSTSGKSPAMAKKIKENLSNQFGSEYADFLVLMGRLRKEILSQGLSQNENSMIFHELVDSKIIESIRRKDWKEVSSELERILGVRISPENVIDYIKAE